MTARVAIRLRPRTVTATALAGFVGVVAFVWPFVVAPGRFGSNYAPPLIFGLLLVLVLAVLFAEVADGGIDAKALAMLGVLSAVGAALRPLGAGTAGVETVFFVLVLAGRVFGAGFGFSLGCTSLFASALITGGVGPWLPYQMFGCAFVGLLAGLLPPVRGRLELAMLAAYGALSGYLFGFLLNLSSWPFSVDSAQLDQLPAGVVVHRAVASVPGLRRDHLAGLGHRPGGHHVRLRPDRRAGRAHRAAPGGSAGQLRGAGGVRAALTAGGGISSLSLRRRFGSPLSSRSTSRDSAGSAAPIAR